MRAEIIGRKENEITLKLFDELTDEEVERYKIGERLFAVVELFDPDSITIEQRNHIYALIGDYCFYTGYSEESTESLFKVKFMYHEMLDELPSLATNQMTKTMASKFIEYIIIYFIQNDIPFRKDQFYLPRESSNYIYWATMNRLCVVCGREHAHLHHAINLVQMGNDRNKHNHLKSKFLMLCFEHHQEAHSMSLSGFCEKYLVQPIKLKERDLKGLNIRGDYTNGNLEAH